MTLYLFLKFFHVLLAIVAVGFNASYGIWLTRAAREPAHTLHVLRGIKVLDDRFANPAYGLLLVTGIAMLVVGDISPRTFWVATALVLYAVLVIVAVVVYSPTLRRQIAMVESGGVDSEPYRRLATRGAATGGALALIVVVIVFLMVTKPTL
ncbi:MAG TPA: DUF2269 family protein [Nitriliruptorales bacterium]|nr:DUF2269 family protein [Nitriliruptorales bacterium]